MGAKWIVDATGENVAGGASAALNDSLWNVENPISLSDRKVSFNSDINFKDIIDKTVKQGDKLAENVKGLILGTKVALYAFIGSNGGSKREESKVTAGNFTFYDTDYQPPTPIPFADDEPGKLAVIPKKPTTPPPTNNVLKPKPAFQEKPSTQFPTAETPKRNFLPISHPTVPFSQPQLKPASPESIEKDKQQITEFRKKAEEATALARILEGKSVESKTTYPNEKVLSDTFRDVQNEGIYNTKANDPNFGHMVRQVGLNEAHKQQEGLAKLHAVLNNKQLLSDNSQSVDDVVKNSLAEKGFEKTVIYGMKNNKYVTPDDLAKTLQQKLGLSETEAYQITAKIGNDLYDALVKVSQTETVNAKVSKEMLVKLEATQITSSPVFIEYVTNNYYPIKSIEDLTVLKLAELLNGFAQEMEQKANKMEKDMNTPSVVEIPNQPDAVQQARKEEIRQNELLAIQNGVERIIYPKPDQN